MSVVGNYRIDRPRRTVGAVTRYSRQYQFSLPIDIPAGGDARANHVRVYILSAVTQWRYSPLWGGEFLHKLVTDSIKRHTAARIPLNLIGLTMEISIKCVLMLR